MWFGIVVISCKYWAVVSVGVGNIAVVDEIGYGAGTVARPCDVTVAVDVKGTTLDVAQVRLVVAWAGWRLWTSAVVGRGRFAWNVTGAIG
jgi:hypothetical protein